MSSAPTVPDLHTLIGLFYDSTAELGEFVEVQPEQMPIEIANSSAWYNLLVIGLS